jgi:5-formyltetrahydrofolate cyclo-ligase
VKELLRQQILLKRSALTPEQVQVKTDQIMDRLWNLTIFNEAASVMLYLDIRNEVKTNKLIHSLLKKNKTVLIPVTDASTRTLTVSRLLDPEKDLVRGHFGLLEPRSDSLRPVDPALINLILVPGLVFDRYGYRIGFGAGYYDRFLSSIKPTIPLISLLYELQLIDQVPREPHDVPVHILVTEDRVIDCRTE